MNNRYMGKTGLVVSELCLGTMTFGRETSEEDSFRIMDRYVEEGGNFFDTANVYTAGASEEILGKWLKTTKRDDYVIATKTRFPTQYWCSDNRTAEANLGSSGWSLSKENMDRLNQASQLFVSYPYDKNAEEQRNRGRK